MPNRDNSTKRGKVSWQIAQREQQQCSNLFFTFVQGVDGRRIVERIPAGRLTMLIQVGKSLGHNQWLVRMKLELAAKVGQVWKKEEHLVAKLVTGSGGPAGLCFTLTVTVCGRTCILSIRNI